MNSTSKNSSAPKSSVNLYVIGSQPLYEDFMADLDNIYSSEEEALEAAKKMNTTSSTTSMEMYEMYEVMTLQSAVTKLVYQARLEGERNSRPSVAQML